MIVFFMALAGTLLALALLNVIFATTSEDKAARESAPSGIRWALVWMLLFMSMFHIHGLQEELETYKTQEQVHGEN